MNQRNPTKPISKRQFRLRVLTFLFVLMGIFLNLYAGSILSGKNNQPQVTQSQQAQQKETRTSNSPQLTMPVAQASAAPKEENRLAALPNFTLQPQNGAPVYGHFPYSEGDGQQMIIIGSYAQGEYQRLERMAPDAAIALMKMIYAARDVGVWITPVSAFRDMARQEQLFQAQIQRKGSPEAAAKVSAPAGHSEHHTGLSLDLADGNSPKQDVSLQFTQTQAFRWLLQNAKDFGFEMSFPENNAQGVSYEPWHWRYVGTPQAQAVFASARRS
jgi:zinc D-Ala-D-Ala carboxypeptidase